MEFRKVLALRGPNVWASFPVLEAWVDLGALNDSSSDEMPGFNDRLMAWLPTLVEHRCSVGERGGFFERLRRGTYLAHILEHVTLELQSLVGYDVGFGKARAAHEHAVYKVAVQYVEEDVARACLETGRQLCLAAVEGRPFDVPAEVAKLKELARRVGLNPSAEALRAAARRRRLPCFRMEFPNLLQLGQGARQRRVLGAQTDRTSAVAESIAGDAELAKSLLRSVGVPVPEGRPVTDAEDAWAAAEEVGLPVVVKARYDNERRDVRRNLTTREAVAEAYAAIRVRNRNILVERSAEGDDCRLLVVGDRVVAAARRTPDGAVDVTDRLHPEVAARAVDAARVLGVDVAGVDLVAADHGRPLEEQGGVVVNVHPKPGLKIHLSPVEGSPRPVAEAILDHLFPDGQTGRVPVVAVTGTNGKTTTTRLIAHIVGQVRRPVGMTCTEGIFLDGRMIQEGDCSGPASARAVLTHPDVEAAVLETARGGILRAGLGFDRCDVAVVTNIGGGDHLGVGDIETAEELAWVKSTIVAATLPTSSAVLRADDPLVAAMAEHCKGSVIYFGPDGDHEIIRKHRAAGGRAAFPRDGRIVLAEGASETPLITLDRVPLTYGGRVAFHVLNAVAAAAAGWALGIPLDAIRAGLTTFTPGLGSVPARFNLMEINGVTVVVDYVHNPDALQAILDAIEQFPHGRRTAIYSAAGDRRDADMVRQGEMLGNTFDRVILYEDAYMRGRTGGEIIGLFRQGLAKGTRVREVMEVRGGVKSVEVGISLAQPGELLLVQPDVISTTVECLQRYLGAGAREIDIDEALAVAAPPAAVHGVEAGRVEVRQTPLGRGVFTLQPLRKGQLVVRDRGEPLPGRSQHSIQVDVDRHVQVPPPMQFLNHSCEPNCGLLLRRGSPLVELYALRPVAAGEELTVDYATFEDDVQHMGGPCLCKAAGCRGRVTGFRDLTPEQRAHYGPYVAEYLRDGTADTPEVRPLVAPEATPMVAQRA